MNPYPTLEQLAEGFEKIEEGGICHVERVFINPEDKLRFFKACNSIQNKQPPQKMKIWNVDVSEDTTVPQGAIKLVGGNSYDHTSKTAFVFEFGIRLPID